MSFQLSLKPLKPKSTKNKRKQASGATATKSSSSSRTTASILASDTVDDEYEQESLAEQANLRKKRKIKITHVDSYDLQSNDTDNTKDLVIKLDENDTEFSAQLITTQEEYDAVPVELFGDAILRGMGWDGKYEDDDVRKNSSGKYTVPYPEGLGIGAKGTNEITDIDSFMPIVKVKSKHVSNTEEDDDKSEKE